jgi:hypothetical protein
MDLEAWTKLVKIPIPGNGRVEFRDDTPPETASYYRALLH